MSPDQMQSSAIADADSDESHSPQTTRGDSWCASLTRFLHLFDIGPRLRIPLIDPDSPINTALHRKLLSIGALRPAPESSLLDCPVCHQTTVRPLPTQERADFNFYCSHCEEIIELPEDPHLLALSPDWLFAELATAFGATRHRPALLLSDHLWEIGEFTLHDKTVNLLVARVENLLAVPKICDRLAALPKHGHYVVLCSWHSLVIESMAVAGRRVFADLHEVANLEFNALTIDVPSILARFDAVEGEAHPRPGRRMKSRKFAHPPTVPAPPIEIAEDRAWVSINGGSRVLLHGKQQEFVLVMAEEYRHGNLQPALEQVLSKAGYEDNTSELHHVSRRDEFLELFGRKGSLVWFKGLVTPK